MKKFIAIIKMSTAIVIYLAIVGVPSICSPYFVGMTMQSLGNWLFDVQFSFENIYWLIFSFLMICVFSGFFTYYLAKTYFNAVANIKTDWLKVQPLNHYN